MHWINDFCEAVKNNWIVLVLVIIVGISIIDELANIYIKIKKSKGDK